MLPFLLGDMPKVNTSLEGAGGGRTQAGLNKHGLPHLTAPPPISSGHLTPVQGLFLVHQLPSVKTGQCYVGGEGGLGGTKPGFT